TIRGRGLLAGRARRRTRQNRDGVATGRDALAREGSVISRRDSVREAASGIRVEGQRAADWRALIHHFAEHFRFWPGIFVAPCQHHQRSEKCRGNRASETAHKVVRIAHGFWGGVGKELGSDYRTTSY